VRCCLAPAAWSIKNALEGLGRDFHAIAIASCASMVDRWSLADFTVLDQADMADPWI